MQVTDEMVEAAAAQMMQYGVNAPESTIYAAARSAITAALAKAWKPIETAPRYETTIIVTDDLGVYGAAWWHDGEQVWLGCDGCTPTHWMPLPAPPIL